MVGRADIQFAVRPSVERPLPTKRASWLANSDDDIRHAFTNARAAITTPDQPDFTMIVGPDLAAQLLELGILATDDNDSATHAMPARTKYVKMIQPKRGGQP